MSSSILAGPASLALLKLPPLPTLPFPPLPKIQDVKLETLVFTHSGIAGKKKNSMSLEMDEDAMEDNQKLEHVGDALLGTVITCLLHELFPKLRQGPATVLKAHLVNNTTLCQLSQRYELPSRLICTSDQRYNLAQNEKTMADIFEAYVAGLFYSHLYRASTSFPRIPTPPATPRKRTLTPDPKPPSASNAEARGQAMDHIHKWLAPLFTPLAHWVLDQMRLEQKRLEATLSATPEEDADAVGATARLNEYFTAKEGNIPTYDSTQMNGMWKVECTAVKKDGTEYRAEAIRNSKKLASTVAAYKIARQTSLIP
ncbi:hypothetical protein M231_05601 [Tremella mesenterica]|uniref:RNase III domain-containing protein n=1 Tax=Tremella mesenterica TaxID=5217 RepID=A0A4Q1BHQ5_TREME|nr:hypothetical protein M231_05601 [Tremella mesenterica]